MEINWKIFTTSNVEVSNTGIVKRFDGFIYSPYLSKDGYPCVNIHMGEKRKTYKLHRLVALLFIDNLFNKPEINHKDGNKLNNDSSNLEWCTHSENIQHAWDTGLLKSTPERSKKISLQCRHIGSNNPKSKKVRGYTKNNEFTIEYESMRLAAKAFNTDSAQVSHSANNILTLNGQKKSAGKLLNKPLFWEFV
jgi:hypothetical protein